ncbi:hypothetical protein TSAR_012813 [Trichomalopsis sarcophagae]|uniref:Uncharacterized protein n=1 Tax=Trichomalopsis sarcophagae TaxID=543379 RepID=A0A232F438_9HYME|nr:hypothetical protein TSAR_012813 [Trichomalopsis sarcophagae]
MFPGSSAHPGAASPASLYLLLLLLCLVSSSFGSSPQQIRQN